MQVNRLEGGGKGEQRRRGNRPGRGAGVGGARTEKQKQQREGCWAPVPPFCRFDEGTCHSSPPGLTVLHAGWLPWGKGVTSPSLGA